MDADCKIATLEAEILDAAARGDIADELRRSESLHRTLTANLPDTSVFLIDRDKRHGRPSRSTHFLSSISLP
jgi:hypothetical protein